MFIGHYGVSFALKRAVPRVSLGTLFLAVQFVDILWAVFILLGIEKARVVPPPKDGGDFAYGAVENEAVIGHGRSPWSTRDVLGPRVGVKLLYSDIWIIRSFNLQNSAPGSAANCQSPAAAAF